MSCDSFSGSTEWSNEDALPNNNVENDEPRSSYYQTPANALREMYCHDQRYRSPNIVDYYTDEWSRTSTFSATNVDSTYQNSSDLNYHNRTSTYQSRPVSIICTNWKMGQPWLVHVPFSKTKFPYSLVVQCEKLI